LNVAAGRGLSGVAPDVLSNAGGVVISCFEWVQDLQSVFWGEAEVEQASVLPAAPRVGCSLLTLSCTTPRASAAKGQGEQLQGKAKG
jgi:hypothetical protein